MARHGLVTRELKKTGSKKWLEAADRIAADIDAFEEALRLDTSALAEALGASGKHDALIFTNTMALQGQMMVIGRDGVTRTVPWSPPPPQTWLGREQPLVDPDALTYALEMLKTRAREQGSEQIVFVIKSHGHKRAPIAPRIGFDLDVIGVQVFHERLGELDRGEREHLIDGTPAIDFGELRASLSAVRDSGPPITLLVLEACGDHEQGSAELAGLGVQVVSMGPRPQSYRNIDWPALLGVLPRTRPPTVPRFAWVLLGFCLVSLMYLVRRRLR